MTRRAKSWAVAALILFTAICIGGAVRMDAGRARVEGYRSVIEMTAQRNRDGSFTLIVDKQNESYGIGDLAVDNVVKTINERQDLTVDVLSGATETSTAAIKCAEKALANAGFDVETMLAEAEQDKNDAPQYIDYRCDVVVVGAGGAGLTAAVTAAQSETSVIVVEKLGIAGGSTARSDGSIMATGTPLQEYSGVSDSTASMAGYLYSFAGPNVRQNKLVSLAEHSAANIEFLESLGVRFSGTLLSAGSDLTKRIHIAVNEKGEASGGAIIKPLLNACDELGVEIIYNCEVTELVRDLYGNVLGVRGTTPEGDVVTVWANATVLATGGYDRSSIMIEDYNKTSAKPAYSYSSEGNTGDGLRLAEAFGAQIFDGTLIAELYDFSCGTNGSGGLLVTPRGERFADESADAFTLGGAIQKAGANGAYLILDGGAGSAALRAGIAAGVVYEADTLQELARMLNAPELAATVETYNQMCENGADGAFGKKADWLTAIGDGPYYAVVYKLKSYGTMGGVETNNNGQVSSAAGFVPNLFACGEVANGYYFDETFPGFGASLAQIIDSGRMTGAYAAKYALEPQTYNPLDESAIEEIESMQRDSQGKNNG